MSAILILRALIIIGAVCFIFAATIAFAKPACGTASWYGAESGNRMANGRRFNPNALTAAMWGPAFGSRYHVTYAGRSVVVAITDRGPRRDLGRIIDLSRAAAEAIRLRGIGRVCLERIR